MMKTVNRFFFSALAVFLWCDHEPSWSAAAPVNSSARTTVTNTVVINGAPGPVFDLITTARFWPQWHPATIAVGGVLERPYGAGDLVHERGRVGDTQFETTWKVVEHSRGSKVVLESQTAPARITYTFKRGKRSTRFTRTLEYAPVTFASVKELERIMRDQSEQALNQLKALVEQILNEETKPLS
jgi:uncharacterized protein YndB with AHSA1/START domain